jgi:hypothetical protein
VREEGEEKYLTLPPPDDRWLSELQRTRGADRESFD